MDMVMREPVTQGAKLTTPNHGGLVRLGKSLRVICGHPQCNR